MPKENVSGTEENGSENSQTEFNASAYENDPKFQEYLNSQREQVKTETEKSFDGLKSNYEKMKGQLKGHKEKSSAYDNILEQNQDDEDAKLMASGSLSLRDYKDNIRKSARESWQTEYDSLNSKNQELSNSLAEKDSLIKQKEISHRVSTAALQDKFFQKGALRDLEMIAERSSDLDENGDLIFRGDDKNVIFGTDGKPLDAKGFIELQKEQRPYMFTQMNGTGSSNSGSNGAAQSISRSEWNKKISSLNLSDRQALINQKSEGLIKIID